MRIPPPNNKKITQVCTSKPKNLVYILSLWRRRFAPPNNKRINSNCYHQTKDPRIRTIFVASSLRSSLKAKSALG